MDERSASLGLDIGTLGPGLDTAIETTVTAEAPTPGRLDDEPDTGRDDPRRPGLVRLDLSFLRPSSRRGSLGKIGDHDVFDVLGRGGMGIVLKARDKALSRVVAVKVQDPALAVNRRSRWRFLRKARAAAAINHPNVVTIHAVNIVAGLPYLVMEYVGGGSLRQRIKVGPPLEPVEVLRIGHQIALGLAAAHAQGVIHRDIKPANILLEAGLDRVKITDFGLAVAGLAVPEGERVAGTPPYMSPEQVRGEKLDLRSDLFSLGCVLYAMIAGHSPFQDARPAESIRLVCELAPPAPASACPCCPKGLSDLILRLLSKAPDDRPGSAAEVAESLRALLVEANRSESGEVPAEPPPPVPAPAEPPPPVPAPAEPPPPAPAPAEAAEPRPEAPTRPPRPVLLTGLAGVVLASAFAAGVAASRRTGPESDPVGPASTAPRAWIVDPSGVKGPKDLAAALRRAGPGDILRLGPGVHDGSARIDDPSRLAGLTIESDGRAVLSASDSPAVVAISGVPGVTIRGLTIETRADQFALQVTGDVDGLTIDRVTFVSPERSQWTQVYLSDGARGSEARPIVVKNSEFHVGSKGGVTIEGAPDGLPVRGVLLWNNRFFGPKEQVHVLQHVRDIEIRGNLFIGGQPLTLNLPGSKKARHVRIANNTFFQAVRWLHPADSDPEQEGIAIVNNAIIASDGLDLGDGKLTRMARGGWDFHHNLWEPASAGRGGSEGPIARRRAALPVLSRDPQSPRFLRPVPGSTLSREGAGGDWPGHVGAFP